MGRRSSDRPWRLDFIAPSGCWNKHAVLQACDGYLHGPAGIARSELAALHGRTQDCVDLAMRWRADHG